MGLGSGHPKLALAVAAASLTDKTERGSLGLLERSQAELEGKIEGSTDHLIHKRIAGPVFSWFYDSDRLMSDLMSEKGRRLMTSAGLFGLGWGILNPETVETCFQDAKIDHERVSPEPFGWQSYQEFLDNCLLLCEQWQRAGGSPVQFADG